MEKFRVEIKKSVYTELKKLGSKDIKAILKKIKNLGENPFPPGSQKLSNQNKYRIRYRQFRILFEVTEGVLLVYVVSVGHRREVYRKLSP